MDAQLRREPLAPRGGQPFPRLRITAEALRPLGSFAEAQAAMLQPPGSQVDRLLELVRAREAGIVAHFYMDPALQGVLRAVREAGWPHVFVADSLKMAEAALQMAEAGVRRLVVLGVDFMSENVRAVLDASGYEALPVYRVAREPIGCSLAEAAEAKAYGAWLHELRSSGRPTLHVVYVNTSLSVKGKADRLVPTITCTSSNVVRLVLQAFAQVPGLHVAFGPDTYMGRNLGRWLQVLSESPPEQVRALHPAHDPGTVAAARERFSWFPEGHCIVHHQFGAEVVRRVREELPEALVTAHLEVPGEMFELGLQAQRAGRGVVGSTSAILGFVRERLAEAVQQPGPARLQVVLGTETGMISAIVAEAQRLLREAGRADVELEVVFPVSAEAVAPGEAGDVLPVLPGPAAGEGCSAAGGCAVCPFMKMNSLEALLDLLERAGREPEDRLAPFAPRRPQAEIDGEPLARAGIRPTLAMRAFQQSGRLPDDLVARLGGER